MGDPKIYFAYGSNMSTERLRVRVPAATPVGRASWPGRRLAFNKIGVDGSGKANLVEDRAAIAWGVLFAIPDEEWPNLDAFEPGYERVECSVTVDSGRDFGAQVYLGVGEFREIPPRDWYRDHLHRGAIEHGLPLEVIQMILTLQQG